jgi:hypothetical protein
MEEGLELLTDAGLESPETVGIFVDKMKVGSRLRIAVGYTEAQKLAEGARGG